jgi:type I restriction enzyme S subunit
MRKARLGDVVVSMKNGLYKPASEYADDGTPCLRMYNIDSGSVVWKDIKRMRVSAGELEEYGLREGDLLVNRVNSRELVGKAAFIPPSLEPSVFESKNIRVRLDASKALPKFINYQMLAGSRRYFAGNAQQVVGMASISQKQLADFPIVLADLAEQRRIVAELEKQFSRLDEAVANLKRVKANLTRYRDQVLSAAITGRLSIEDLPSTLRRSDESATALLERVLWLRRTDWDGRGRYREPASPFENGPVEARDGWVLSTVEQLAWVDVGFAFRSAEFSEEGIRLLRGENIEPGCLRWEDVRHWSPSKLAGFEHLLLDEGQIVLAMDRPIISSGLKLARVRATDLPCLLVQRMTRLRCVDRSVEPYLYIAMSTERFRRHLLGGQTGTQLPHVSGATIASFVVPLPPPDEQSRIVAEVERRLSIVREVEAEVAANLKRAQVLRQAVLASAFGAPRESGAAAAAA